MKNRKDATDQEIREAVEYAYKEYKELHESGDLEPQVTFKDFFLEECAHEPGYDWFFIIHDSEKNFYEQVDEILEKYGKDLK